jgi:hypothetical protein
VASPEKVKLGAPAVPLGARKGSVEVTAVVETLSRFVPDVLTWTTPAAEEQTPLVVSPVKLYGGARQLSAAGPKIGVVIVPPVKAGAPTAPGGRVDTCAAAVAANNSKTATVRSMGPPFT